LQNITLRITNYIDCRENIPTSLDLVHTAKEVEMVALDYQTQFHWKVPFQVEGVFPYLNMLSNRQNITPGHLDDMGTSKNSRRRGALLPGHDHQVVGTIVVINE
jgi:hypothetical protein